MGKHTPRPRSQAWSCLKYTFLQSAPGLPECTCELLAAESTPLVSSGTAAHTADESHHQC
ncbi:unnamed protein product [Staurois parvus]|uniref:Uncharacterized protein n=1 Tax=Staurois parvus TaxID=386267 RepID=A0ABN9H8I7_9NEOB|nr:unnamed protein product [Staurois parvus]